MKIAEDALAIISRGTQEILVEDALRKKLAEGRPCASRRGLIRRHRISILDIRS